MFAAVCLISGASPATCLAQRVVAGDTMVTIHGRVHSATGPVARADVLVTPLGSRETWHGSSDARGEFTVRVPASGGRYLIVISAPGYSSRRFAIASDSVPAVFDIVLEPSPTAVLKPVETRAVRRRPPARDDGMGSDYSGNAVGSPVPTGLSGDLNGNLDALVATIPGVQLTRNAAGEPAGFSVLGLGAEQNNTVLNGAIVNTHDLPRDAGVTAQVATTVYDPTRGGFSGGQLALRARPGARNAARSMRATLDAPFLQAADPVASAIGGGFTDLQVSGVASGPVHGGHLLYNAAVQVGRRTRRLPALNASRGGAAAPVPSAAARSFLDAVTAAGIPIVENVTASSDNASALLRLDRNPGGTTNANIVLTAHLRDSHGLDASPFSVAGYGQTSRSAGASLVGSLSSYVKGTVLHDLRAAASWSKDRARSNLALPGAVVTSAVNAGSVAGPGDVTLLAGGDVNVPAGSRAWTGQLIDELTWHTVDNRHQLRVTVDGRLESLTFSPAGQSFGQYAFNSIDDFRNARPAYFARTFASERPPIHATIGAVSAGDVFQITERITAQYGARLDAGRYRAGQVTGPGLVGLVDLGVDDRTGFSFAEISPRAGLNVQYGRESRIEGMGGGPKGTITFGIGAFRDVPGGFVLGPVVLNGAGFGTTNLVCTGDATVGPDWAAFLTSPSNIPASCLPGFPALSAGGPSVTRLQHGFSPPTSWRASMGWDAFITSQWRLSLNGVYSLTTALPEAADVNFTGVPAFTLASERGRPVFVRGASIDMRTGSINPGASRVSDAFATVTQLRSDLHAHAAQVVATIAPNSPVGAFDGSLNYTFTRARSEQGGLFGSTARGPNEITWGPAANVARHEFNVVGALWFGRTASVNLWARLRSGTPFTPYVNRDINGDGFANDRAYVPDPAQRTSLDAALAAPITTLVRTAPSYASRCVQANRGRIAGPGACAGPWTTLLNAQLSLRPGFFRSDRIAADVSLINLPAAADLILHGSAIRGWGESAGVDPVLLRVTGFNPSTSSYQYAVNPSFGQRVTAESRLRSSFRMTVGVRVALGSSTNQQLVDATRQMRAPPAAPDSTRKAAVARILDRLERTFPDVVQGVIAARDSIRLTPVQVDSLWALDRQFVGVSDSLWTPVAEYLSEHATQGEGAAEAMAKLNAAQKVAARLAERMAVGIKAILTPQQIAQFPPLFAVLLDERRVGSLLTQSYRF